MYWYVGVHAFFPKCISGIQYAVNSYASTICFHVWPHWTCEVCVCVLQEGWAPTSWLHPGKPSYHCRTEITVSHCLCEWKFAGWFLPIITLKTNTQLSGETNIRMEIIEIADFPQCLGADWWSPKWFPNWTGLVPAGKNASARGFTSEALLGALSWGALILSIILIFSLFLCFGLFLCLWLQSGLQALCSCLRDKFEKVNPF